MLATHRIPQGTDATFKVPLLVDDVETAIIGWSLVSMIKASAEDADEDAIATCNAGNGGVAAFSATSWLVSIPPAATQTQTPGRYFLEHKGFSPSGKPHRLELCYCYIDPSFIKAD